MRKFTVVSALLLVCSSLVGSGVLAAGTQVSRTFTIPVRLSAAVDASGCTNNPGPQITLQGEFALGGMSSEFIFRNNAVGTHTYTSETKVNDVLVPAGQTITIPKQPVLGGVGGNPFIWIQLTDEQGRALTSEIYLGRCVQGHYKA